MDLDLSESNNKQQSRQVLCSTRRVPVRRVRRPEMPRSSSLRPSIYAGHLQPSTGKDFGEGSAMDLADESEIPAQAHADTNHLDSHKSIHAVANGCVA